MRPVEPSLKRVRNRVKKPILSNKTQVFGVEAPKEELGMSHIDPLPQVKELALVLQEEASEIQS